MKLKLAAISVNPSNNSRANLGEIESLRESMATVGQLSPVIVDSDRRLVAGFRRYEAAQSLGWDEIDAIVLPPGAPTAAINLAENDARLDITTAERARGYHLATAAGMTPEQICAALGGARGASLQNVKNLERAWRKLPQSLRDEWVAGAAWARNVARVIEISAEKSHRAMIEAAHSEPAAKTAKKAKVRTAAQIQQLIDLIDSGGDSVEIDVRDALLWVLCQPTELDDLLVTGPAE